MKSDDVVTEEQSIGMATDPRGLLHWLNTTPKPGHPCAKTLEREFPGALPGIAVQKRSSAVLLEKFGLGGENTIYGQSICPDEINNEKGGLADLMKEYWGEVFPWVASAARRTWARRDSAPLRVTSLMCVPIPPKPVVIDVPFLLTSPIAAHTSRARAFEKQPPIHHP